MKNPPPIFKLKIFVERHFRYYKVTLPEPQISKKNSLNFKVGKKRNCSSF